MGYLTKEFFLMKTYDLTNALSHPITHKIHTVVVQYEVQYHLFFIYFKRVRLHREIWRYGVHIVCPTVLPRGREIVTF